MKYFNQRQIQVLRLTLEKTLHLMAKNKNIIWEEKLYMNFPLRAFYAGTTIPILKESI